MTADERALYDRQIRLWGAEAQGRLSCGRMLVVGDTECGLAQELSKNVVLAGVSCVTFCPANKNSAQGGTMPGFLGANMEEICESLRAMNPLVTIKVTDDVNVAEADVVCSIRGSLSRDTGLSEKCALAGVPFLCGRVCGLLGWVFFDLGAEFSFTEASKPPTSVHYPTFTDALASQWGGERKRSAFGWQLTSLLLNYEEKIGTMPSNSNDGIELKKIYEQMQAEKKPARTAPVEAVDSIAMTSGVELPALSAVVGGVWGREVVKILCRNDLPLKNLFFYNANTTVGAVETVGGTA